MAKFSDIVGIIGTNLKLGISNTAVLLKSVSSGLVVRNATDTANSSLTASELNASGDVIRLNSDGSSGADRVLTLARPATGMTANWQFTYPTNPGTPGYILQTNGSGVTDWVPNAGSANQATVDTTSLEFNSVSPLSLFTLPADAAVLAVRIYVDTAFEGGVDPLVSIGVAGQPSKYVPATPLGTVAQYEYFPSVIPSVSSEPLIATYVSGGSTSGLARIHVEYATPS